MTSGEGDITDRAYKINEAKRICYGLQSEDKRTRKNSLLELEKHLSADEYSDQDLRVIFNETQIYTVNALRDKAEAVRSQAIKFLRFLIVDKLAKNDYYLTYIFPVLVERIGTVELNEESEEIRLELVQFVRAIIDKYAITPQLKPFLNDCVIILRETVKDKHPDIKGDSCKAITELSEALPQDFHQQAETLVKPVLTCFGYQRYRIRMEAILCMADIIMNSTYKALEEAVGPLAERLFDQIPAVRQTVAKVAFRLLTEYRDRYSFFQKLLPLIMTGLNDEVPDTSELASALWEKVGLQYERENEKDLKDQMDFLIYPPKFYPDNLKRPNLGCRVLVQRNVGKIAPALARELGSWQGDVRVRCSQLLCAVVHHAEDGLTQHLQELLAAMYHAARDDDPSVVANIIRGSELIGTFVLPDTWLKLILPAIEDGPHFGQLTVLAGLIRGAPKEHILSHLNEISTVLVDNNVCRSRKVRYQQEMIKCVQAILVKMDREMTEVAYNLFVIILTVVSLRDDQNKDSITFSIVDKLSESMGLENPSEVWSKFTTDLLIKIDRDPRAWTPVTFEKCIFENILLHSGRAFGENLLCIGNILENALDIESDAESRLQIFVALSSALETKDEAFKNANNLEEFLRKLLTDVLVPTLVWHAGRTAEAMRTIAAFCLCNALNPGTYVDLFPNQEVLKPFFDKLLPLLLSLTEDASSRSRELALKALTLLKETASRRDCWDVDNLIKIYAEILKRLDDPTDCVRLAAIKALPIILSPPPEEFTKVTYNGHHEFILEALLTHFDDDDEALQALIADCLKKMVEVTGKNTLIKKINKHKPLLRKQKECEQILASL